MKWLLSLLLLFVVGIGFAQLPLIHAHNDYQKTEPLTNALRNKVFSIEADVYLFNGELRVAHDKNELTTAPTLDALYLRPISDRMILHKNLISIDSNYLPVLMIDIKENSKGVLIKLMANLNAYPSSFNRIDNPNAVQVVISGDRGPVSSWKDYPDIILFDGRPNEVYDSAALRKLAFVSDSYVNYSIPADSLDNRLQRVARQVHDMNKLLRIWAIPDNPGSWDHLRHLGVDIINTDKVTECRNYFSKGNKQ